MPDVFLPCLNKGDDDDDRVSVEGGGDRGGLGRCHSMTVALTLSALKYQDSFPI